MTILLPQCPRPTTPGIYLCQRSTAVRAELVEIRRENEELWYYGYISMFPLQKLEDTSQFWGPVILM